MSSTTKLCRHCKQVFVPARKAQKVCSPHCGLMEVREKRSKAADKAWKEETKKRREALMTLSEYKKRAQVHFNAYIRERDRMRPCVSCGQDPFKGARHASHFRSRAAAPQLAYNTFNCAASCAQCNSMKSGNITPYRAELVNRIGGDRVIRLENDNTPAHFTKEYLVRLGKVFAKRARHLKKLREKQLARDSGF